MNNNIRIKFLGDNALQQNEIYDLQVYVRDLALSNVTQASGANTTFDVQKEGLTFDNDLSNPSAGAFKLDPCSHKLMLPEDELIFCSNGLCGC